MRFLGIEAEGRNIMPINFIYKNVYKETDYLMIVYKDIDTGEKFVKNIENPEIYVHIVKEQYRGKEPTAENPFNKSARYRTDFFDMDQCDRITVKYKTRRFEVAKILGISPDDVDSSPYVAGTDIDIRHWYFVEFLHEYRNDLPKTLNVGYSDIETDSRGFSKAELWRAHGKMPITCITYICDARHQVFVFIMNNPEYGRMQEIVDNLDKLKQQMIEKFTPKYGEAEYSLMLFDNEIDMITAYWNLVKYLKDDFLLFWNAPFDVGNLTKRPLELGYDPYSIVCDKEFAIPYMEFEEDRSTFVLHKKKHKMTFAIMTLIECQMKMYAGIRSAEHKLPSTALDVIAEKEIDAHKDKYNDYGDINKFLLNDFWNYILYNVNDVWLQVGIGRETKDVDDVYSRMYSNMVLSSEVFTSTMLWAQYIKYHVEEDENKILCNNKNKNLVATQEMIEYGYDSDATDEDSDEDENEDIDAILNDISEQQSLIDKETGKKKKFAGAIVQNPKRMSPTGVVINGQDAKYSHKNCIDEDITSEYPSAIESTNLSNDTFVGKVYMDNPDDIKLPFYGQYSFMDDDASKYKVNKAALMMETVSQGDYMLAGEIAFNLPNVQDLEEELMKEM